MTTRSIREQCKDRLQQRANRQEQIDQRAADVVAHVLNIELIHAPDVEVTAEFIDVVDHMDTFHVKVYVAQNVSVEGATLYRVSPTIGPNRQQIELSVERDYFGDAPAQEWRSLRTGVCFNDIVNAILDATCWTLEDLP